MRIFFSVGEPSGDLHAANLIRALQKRNPHIECRGYGGPLMAEAGCQLDCELTALAVMWFLRVLLNLHKFLYLVYKANRYFRDERPDAVVLVDYPGFNWWIAARAKKHGIPVFYYTPPQIWAWGSWRVAKMRKYVDHVLCALPFEADWFRGHGCNAVFVGHPYFDEVRQRKLDDSFIRTVREQPGPLVTILPGSRTQEVEHNLRWFLKAAATIRDSVPEARFAIASFKHSQAEIAQELAGQTGLPIEVYVQRTPELIEAADCCMAVSGSVSLELLYHGKPTVVLYWIGRFAYWVQGFFRRVRYITLVNLLTAPELYPSDLTPYDPTVPGHEHVLFPEYLTCEDRSAYLAAHVVEWLTQPEARAARVAQLAELRARIAHGGASNKAADYMLSVLGAGATAGLPNTANAAKPAPHFVPATQTANR